MPAIAPDARPLRLALVVGLLGAGSVWLGGSRVHAGQQWAACARLDAPAIDECSGIVASRRFPGVLWVHNDSGDRARFFGVDARGTLLAEVDVDGAQNVDWEDIAVDDSGQVYLGDFGNNRNKRRDLVVYVVDEPDPRGRAGPLHVRLKRRIAFHFPDQKSFPDSAQFNFDCEAMFWRAGRLYLLTKHGSDLGTSLYRLDPRAAAEQAAEKLGTMDIGSPVTAADCTPDGREVAVLSYQYLDLFEWPASGDNFLAGRHHATMIEGRQCEGVCFDLPRVLFTNEQREIYCVSARGLWSMDRYLPQPPRVGVPWVVPSVDGRPDEWRRLGSAGLLAFDRYAQGLGDAASAPSGSPPDRRRSAAAAESVQVRVGWSPEGFLVDLGWRPRDRGPEADSVVAWLMLGIRRSGMPCLETGQSAWAVVESGDSLVVRAAEPDAEQPACAPRPAEPRPRQAAQRMADWADVEVLLSVREPGRLVAGSELIFNVVLVEAAPGGGVELGWSASRDMQPLGNPLLWGVVKLEPRRGGGDPD